MNIMYITHEENIGGSTKALIELIQNLKKNNIYVVVLRKSGEAYDAFKKENINIIYLRHHNNVVFEQTTLAYIRSYIKIFDNFIKAIKLSYLVKKYNIEIIHTNCSIISIGAIVNSITKVPHVFHIREYFEIGNQRYTRTIKKEFNYINKHSTKIILISKYLYNEYEKYFSKEKMNLIYDGVDVLQYSSKNKKNNQKEINILVCGLITESKGQEDVIEALNIINKKYNKIINLIFAGNWDEKYKNRLEKKIEKYGLKNRVKFLGFISDLKKIREESYIEINCSRSEGFGRTTVEAILSKNIVIAANNSATKEIIRDGINGFLYKTGDYIELASKIEYVLNNRKEIDKIIDYAYNEARNIYSSKTNSDKILNLYENILSKK